MVNKYEVDWFKTKENIKSRLKGKVHHSCFSELFSYSVRDAQRKLQPGDPTELTIGEIVIIAKYLCCDVLDLIVLNSDSYISPMQEYINCWEKVEHNTPEKLKESFRLQEKLDESIAIRDVYELLLYLPLVDDEILRDVVFRCWGNLHSNNREYIRKQLSYLHRTIASCPEKEYADSYRDNVLRIKGDPIHTTFDNQHSKEYFYNLLRYRYEGNSIYRNHTEDYKLKLVTTKYGIIPDATLNMVQNQL